MRSFLERYDQAGQSTESGGSSLDFLLDLRYPIPRTGEPRSSDDQRDQTEECHPQGPMEV